MSLLHDVELVIELFGAIERPPVHLDRFVGLILAGQRLGQPEHDAAVIGIGTNRPAQGVETLLGPSEPEAELGKELVAFGIPGAAASKSRPALSACSTRPSRASSRATPVKCSMRLRRSISDEAAKGLGRVAQAAG